MAALRLIWHQMTTTSWLCDTLVLGTAVAVISSTCTLAFTSALMRLPKTSAEVSYNSYTSAYQNLVTSSTCATHCSFLTTSTSHLGTTLHCWSLHQTPWHPKQSCRL
ncbi:hypothetical protein KC19_VG203000 [Ceratodon purpureus]|uniref:Uncharacterized protein n=1 Tax=Ceratodon purpureus TaxID=3225 RepID=A0A8T0HSJ7_CERPU|nr:hypothetical protein KC19_VG203000 [Ceratodon purpureus]